MVFDETHNKELATLREDNKRHKEAVLALTRKLKEAKESVKREMDAGHDFFRKMIEAERKLSLLLAVARAADVIIREYTCGGDGPLVDTEKDLEQAIIEAKQGGAL